MVRSEGVGNFRNFADIPTIMGCFSKWSISNFEIPNVTRSVEESRTPGLGGRGFIFLKYLFRLIKMDRGEAESVVVRNYGCSESIGELRMYANFR